jgi:hypothetical protein
MAYSNHFKRILPHIENVPNRTDILLHPANTVEELRGCVGLGKNSIQGGLTKSRIYSDSLNRLLSSEANSTITIS